MNVKLAEATNEKSFNIFEARAEISTLKEENKELKGDMIRPFVGALIITLCFGNLRGDQFGK